MGNSHVLATANSNRSVENPFKDATVSRTSSSSSGGCERRAIRNKLRRQPLQFLSAHHDEKVPLVDNESVPASSDSSDDEFPTQSFVEGEHALRLFSECQPFGYDSSSSVSSTS
ncbi:hypothetical protein DIPPA_33872 [Diplonema papillatum]|nr:hypothetical protein DIPPA_33872 [Diplonema papillatum]